MTEAVSSARAVVWFDDSACLDVLVAGGKGASLARMTAEGLPVPPGFAVASHTLEQAIDAERLRALARAQDHVEAQRLIAQSEPPHEEIVAAYERLGGQVAVRSSACAEDSETASYAGQQETYLHVSGSDEVCRKVVDCWSSFFSERALFYRGQKGSLDDLRMAVVIQTMVEPDKSGVLFTAHPVSRRRDRMVLEAVYGIGEQVVSGEVTPDHYMTDRAGVVKKERLFHGGVLDPEEIRQLIALGCLLEERFGSPQDIEWAIAGEQVYLLQSRPVTTL
jgi:pyruvate,water dikinase